MGVPVGVTQLSGLLEAQLDAISFAVPAPAQLELGALALAAGKHAFFEKPLAMDVPSAERLQSLAQQRKCITALNFEFPESPAWLAAKRVLDSAELGALRHAALTWRIESYANRQRLDDSWKTRTHEGGGALHMFTSHALYNLEWLLGPLASLAATIARAPGDPRDIDTWNALQGVTRGGVPFVAHVATDAFLGPGHRLEVYADRGSLLLENTGRDYIRGFRLLTATRERGAFEELATQAAPAAGEDGRIAATARLASRFLDALLGVAPQPVPGVAEGVRVAHLAEAALRSQREQRSVAV